MPGSRTSRMMASGLRLGGQGERLLGGGGRGDGMALGGQGALQRPADGFLVIDDQDVFHQTPRVPCGRRLQSILR